MAWRHVESLRESLGKVMKSSDAWLRLSLILRDELEKHDPEAAERLFSLHRDRPGIVSELRRRFPPRKDVEQCP